MKLLSFSHAATPPTVSEQMTAIVKDQLAKIDAKFPKTASSNVTNWPDANCPRCNAGLGEATAAAAYATKDPAMLARSKQIFDDMLAHSPQPGLAKSAANEGDSPGQGSMFFVTELAPSLMMLRPQLDAAHIASWTKSITNTADWLDANGDPTYYANGNINIGIAGVMAAAYHETGNPSYLAKYKKALDFVEKPTLPRWAGYGFIVTKQPTKADGSDGAGYFTETGAGGTGLDIDYTQFQADQLNRIYLINHDPKILYFMNMLMNTLMTRVDKTKMTLDTGGGSRHIQPSPRLISFSTVAYANLVKNGRSDLAPYLVAEQAETQRFLSAEQYYAPGWLYDFGMNPGAAMMVEKNFNEPTRTPAVSTDVTPPPQATIKATVLNATTVNLTWTQPADNLGVVKYFIRRQGPTSNWPYATITPATIFTDTAALPSTNYAYSIQAVDAAGNVAQLASPVRITTPAATTTTVLPGDVNGDKRVNALDLSVLLTHDGQNFPAADFNKDGTVGSADLAILLSKWTW